MFRLIRRLVTLALVAVVLWVGWRLAFDLNKDEDNLPALAYVTASGLDELRGYSEAQLEDLWGRATEQLSDTEASWTLPNGSTLVVTFDSDGRVASAELIVS